MITPNASLTSILFTSGGRFPSVGTLPMKVIGILFSEPSQPVASCDISDESGVNFFSATMKDVDPPVTMHDMQIFANVINVNIAGGTVIVYLGQK
jgi:hypothetical protein